MLVRSAREALSRKSVSVRSAQSKKGSRLARRSSTQPLIDSAVLFENADHGDYVITEKDVPFIQFHVFNLFRAQHSANKAVLKDQIGLVREFDWFTAPLNELESHQIHANVAQQLKLARILVLLFDVTRLRDSLEEQLPLWGKMYSLFLSGAIPKDDTERPEFAQVFAVLRTKLIVTKMLGEEEYSETVRQLTDLDRAFEMLDVSFDMQNNITSAVEKTKQLFKYITDENGDLNAIHMIQGLRTNDVVSAITRFLRETLKRLTLEVPVNPYELEGGEEENEETSESILTQEEAVVPHALPKKKPVGRPRKHPLATAIEPAESAASPLKKKQENSKEQQQDAEKKKRNRSQSYEENSSDDGVAINEEEEESQGSSGRESVELIEDSDNEKEVEEEGPSDVELSEFLDANFASFPRRANIKDPLGQVVADVEVQIPKSQSIEFVPRPRPQPRPYIPQKEQEKPASVPQARPEPRASMPQQTKLILQGYPMGYAPHASMNGPLKRKLTCRGETQAEIRARLSAQNKIPQTAVPLKYNVAPPVTHFINIAELERKRAVLQAKTRMNPSEPKRKKKRTLADEKSKVEEPNDEQELHEEQNEQEKEQPDEEEEEEQENIPRQRQRRNWTPEQLEALKKGMEKYGTQWVKILQHFGSTEKDPLFGRTGPDLKDKARNEKTRLMKENRELGPFAKASIY